MSFTTIFSRNEIPYTGVELRPHFLLEKFGLKGSGVGAFIGSCRVETSHLVDWEDRLAQDHIAAGRMVHFIGEFFGRSMSLSEGVAIQRLFMAILADVIREGLAHAGETARALELRREGDDLFFGDRKLSVSIVTASAVSLLLHIGINVDPAGAPVAAIGLDELGLSARVFAEDALTRFRAEIVAFEWACAKVRPVV